MQNLVDWSALPTDLLLLILGRLPIKDYLRAGAVCVSWNGAAAAKLVPSAPSLPWLMVDPIGKGFSKTRAMFDPFSGREEVTFQLQPRLYFIGSTSCGCLLYSGDNNTKLLVTNPLTGRRLFLPSTATLNPKLDGQCRIKNVALLGRPATVVAIAFYHAKECRDYVAFSRPRDKRWTLLCDGRGVVVSMIFHKQLLYVLTRFSGTTIWDLRNDHSPRLRSTLKNCEAGFKYYVDHMYLVESSTGHNLMQVHATMAEEHAIYKLEEDHTEDTPTWRRVASLCGNDALMLSLGRAVCVSTTDFSVLQRNCIYSILRQWSTPFATAKKRKFSFLERLMNVFNLSNGTMESLPLQIKDGLQLDWFTPCL